MSNNLAGQAAKGRNVVVVGVIFSCSCVQPLPDAVAA